MTGKAVSSGQSEPSEFNKKRATSQLQAFESTLRPQDHPKFPHVSHRKLRATNAQSAIIAKTRNGAHSSYKVIKAALCFPFKYLNVLPSSLPNPKTAG